MGVDIHFGAQESELGRVADLQWWQGGGLLQSMWPKSMGRKIACSFWEIMFWWKGGFHGWNRGEDAFLFSPPNNDGLLSGWIVFGLSITLFDRALWIAGLLLEIFQSQLDLLFDLHRSLPIFLFLRDCWRFGGNASSSL